MTRRIWGLALIGGSALLGCSSTPRPAPTGCDRFTFVHASTDIGTHVASCTDQCGNDVNPPTGGRHCGSTLSCHRYDDAQSRCLWLHNLEHGHAVFLYNCPGGCPDLVDALDRIRAGVPKGSNGVPRALVVGDPNLPTKVSAVVWGWSYSSDTVDEEAISCLLSHQDEEALEPNLACSG